MLLCGDWGTSNFRLYLLDKHGLLIDKISYPQGIASTHQQWSTSNANRVAYYQQYLLSQIQRLQQKSEKDLNGIPLVLTGMATASIGIKEIAYKNLPFSLSEPTLNHYLIRANHDFPHDTVLFGGLKSENDVMRGEETQILGLYENLLADNCLYLLPGTHSKHIRIQDAEIVDFQTYMTGELFQILIQHSILKNSIKANHQFTTIEENYFRKGVESAKKNPFLNNLFKGRTNDILLKVSPVNNYYYLSGLVIGEELKSLQDCLVSPVVLGASAPLSQFYQMAFKILYPQKKLITISSNQMELAIPKAQKMLLQKCYNQ